MPATIKIKNSSTASAVPTSSDLVQGELAVNVTDKRIFTENASGTVVELGTNPTILTMGAAGSASAPVITRTGDTNTGIFFPAADTIAFAEGGVEAMRLDSAGNLGLGVTPSAWGTLKALEFAGATSVASDGTAIQLTSNAYFNGTNWIYKNSAGAGNYYINNNTHNWRIAGSGTAGNAISFTQAMTLDASGNLGIGTTSPNSSSFSKAVTLNGAGSAGYEINIAGTNIGYVGGDSGQIYLRTSGANPLTFGTNGTERARIDSSGNLLVGTTATDSGAKTRIVYGASSNGIQVKDSADTSNTAFVIFQNGSNSNIGTISRVGTTNVVAYNTTSDERLKNDLGVAVSDTVIDALVIHDFSWKTDGTLDRGVFAQEAAIVKPLAVREGSNELDENGVPKNPWGVDYSKFVPDLIVYCQQLKKQVQQLQADVAALKA